MYTNILKLISGKGCNVNRKMKVFKRTHCQQFRLEIFHSVFLHNKTQLNFHHFNVHIIIIIINVLSFKMQKNMAPKCGFTCRCYNKKGIMANCQKDLLHFLDLWLWDFYHVHLTQFNWTRYKIITTIWY